MDKKNWWVILGLLVVIAVIAVIGFALPKPVKPPVITVTDPSGIITTIAPEPTATVIPATDIPVTDAPATAAPSAEPGQPEASADVPAAPSPRAWLLITVDNKTYAPYPLTKNGEYKINQKKKNALNVIHVTENSIQMASSTCDNQVCVYEGEVTLENKESRILGGYIVCLPNGVTLQLLDENEYAELTGQTP